MNLKKHSTEEFLKVCFEKLIFKSASYNNNELEFCGELK